MAGLIVNSHKPDGENVKTSRGHRRTRRKDGQLLGRLEKTLPPLSRVLQDGTTAMSLLRGWDSEFPVGLYETFRSSETAPASLWAAAWAAAAYLNIWEHRSSLLWLFIHFLLFLVGEERAAPRSSSGRADSAQFKVLAEINLQRFFLPLFLLFNRSRDKLSSF